MLSKVQTNWSQTQGDQLSQFFQDWGVSRAAGLSVLKWRQSQAKQDRGSLQVSELETLYFSSVLLQTIKYLALPKILSPPSPLVVFTHPLPCLLLLVKAANCSALHSLWDSHYKLQPIYPLLWATGNRKADNSVSLWFLGPLTLLNFQAENCYSSSWWQLCWEIQQLPSFQRWGGLYRERNLKVSGHLNLTVLLISNHVRDASAALGNFSQQGRTLMVKVPG